jgi:hypothetical protein
MARTVNAVYGGLRKKAIRKCLAVCPRKAQVIHLLVGKLEDLKLVLANQSRDFR